MNTITKPNRHIWIDHILVYPGMDQDGLLQKISVFAVQSYVLIMTVLAFILKTPALTAYGIGLLTIGVSAILLYTFGKKKNLEWVIYLGMILSILLSFYFILTLGGITRSGGLIMAGPTLIILSLVFRNKAWTLLIAALYLLTILVAVFLQPLLAFEAGLSSFQNLLFFTCNTFLLSGVTVSVILSLFNYSQREYLARKAREKLNYEKALTKTSLYAELESVMEKMIHTNIELTNRALSEDGPTNTRLLKSIKKREKFMLLIVQQLHELSRMEAGILETKKAQSDFIKFTKHLVQEYQQFASSRGVKIKFQTNFEQFNIDFAPQQVARLFSLLLSDSIFRSAAGSDINVSVNREHENSFKDLVEIIISDNGQPIPEKELKLYFKGEEHDMISPDDGEMHARLSYTLCGSLVRFMRGKIFARSKTDRGTRIRIHLPVQNALPFVGHQELVRQIEVAAYFLPGEDYQEQIPRKEITNSQQLPTKPKDAVESMIDRHRK